MLQSVIVVGSRPSGRAEAHRASDARRGEQLSLPKRHKAAARSVLELDRHVEMLLHQVGCCTAAECMHWDSEYSQPNFVTVQDPQASEPELLKCSSQRYCSSHVGEMCIDVRMREAGV